MNKIRVVWVCHLSNPEIRDYLHQRVPWWECIGRRLMHKAPACLVDFALWNTNAIHEFEKYEDAELHIVAPVDHVKRKDYRLTIRGVHFYFFRDEDDFLVSRIKQAFRLDKGKQYQKNRSYIKKVISEVKPHLVHVIGAENPYYSLSLLDVPSTIPTILQLQTLMNDPDFFENYPISKDEYNYRAGVEKRVIQSATYVATRATKFIPIVLSDIKPDAKILDLTLPLGEEINLEKHETSFDFVYFAKNISKAVDYAIEAFAIAFRSDNTLTLDVIGNYSQDEKEGLNKRIREIGIEKAITFEGMLPTHDDVIKQVRKSRFALLPLKIDLTSGTIREAMANGLPVVTTDTGELGTQKLNLNEECVLISPQGDHEAMAKNMLRLVNDSELVEKLRSNSIKKAKTKQTNAQIVMEWKDAYHSVLGVQL